MKQKICRVWSISDQLYTNHSMPICEIDGILYIDSDDDYIIESYIGKLYDFDIYVGDVIIVNDIFDNKEYYIIEKNSVGEVMASNKSYSISYSEFISRYDEISIIGNINSINKCGQEIYENVCPNCLTSHIMILPKNSDSFYCDTCESMY